MKTVIITLVSGLLIFSNALASKIQISSFNQQPFKVNINGQVFKSNNQAILTINNIAEGIYNVEVLPVVQNYNNFPYSHKPMQVLYRGQMQVYNNTAMYFNLMPNNLVLTSAVALLPYNGYFPNQSNAVNNYHGNQANNNCNNYHHHNYQPTTSQQVYPMQSVAFEQLIQTLNNTAFSSSRLNVYKQALASNYFTTQQVVRIMNEFHFSGDKLEVAKSAYTFTVDPQNYFMVNNAFNFSSDVAALNQYIASL